MIPALALTAVLLATVPTPIVAVIDLPTPLMPDETAPLPPVPEKPMAPVQPDLATGDESAWAAFREAEAAYAAAREQAAAMATARREAERAVRDAARARVKAERAAGALAHSVEYAVKRLRVFEVRNAREVRSAAGEAIELLRERAPTTCLLEIPAFADATYVVTLLAEVGEPEIRVRLIELSRPTAATPDSRVPGEAVVLAEGTVAVGGSARDLIPNLFVRAMANELDRCYARAQTLAEGLSWPAALAWVGRCLAIDSNHGPSLFLAGQAFFEQGDLRSAEKRLQQAILQEEEIGEASHLLALIALRKGRSSTAAAHFEAAIANERDSFEARLLLGRSLIDRNAALAAAHLEKAVALRPNHGEANFLLGLLRVLQGDSDRAPGHLELAVAADYKAGDAHFELGSLAQAAGDEPSAVSHFESARERGRTSPEVLLLLGRHYVATDPARAVATLAEARRKGARGEDLDLNLGKAALLAGETNVGISALRRALAVEAHEAEARVLLAETYVAQGNLPLAAAHYGPAIRLGRDSYQARVVIAEANVQRGETAIAVEHFSAALRHRPGDGRASYGLAMVLLGEKETNEAVAHLERALAAGHRVAEVRAHLGRALRLLGDREAALAHFAAAAAAKSREPDVYRALALARDEAGNIDGAVATWKEVLALVPGDAQASFRLGKLRMQQGRPELARPLLEHAAKARPFRGRAHRLLARLARDRRDATEALFHYEEAVKIVDADFELFANAGWAALEAGRDDLARHYLARALAFRPGEGKLGFALGEIDVRGGRYAEARAFFQIALVAEHRTGETHHRLGDVAGRLGEKERQAQHYRQAIAAGVDNAALYLALADLAAESGANDEAVRYYTAGARAALREANHAAAKKALESGLTLAPDARELTQLAEQLAGEVP